MKVLVTGAKGFIGKNLVARLNELNTYEVIAIDRSNSREELVNGLLEAEFIFHLAGVNIPKEEKEFFEICKFEINKIQEEIKEKERILSRYGMAIEKMKDTENLVKMLE